MNTFFYIILFIMGTLFGSFYTLAVYRIPKNIDIIKKHSYCPNCNHKLGFFELIPILSYIFLGGKCKNCKQKIRIRYLILEVIGGVSFVVLGYALNLKVENLNIQNIILFSFIVLYLTAIILISGIDKEYVKIDKKVLAYGIIISIIYMIYLYTIDATSIYRYAIYLALYIILLSMDTFLLRRYAEDNYIIDICMYLTMILIFTGTSVYMKTLVMTMLSILIYLLIMKLTQKKNRYKKIKLNEIPIGYFIGASNITVLLIISLLVNNI